jgi:hypothetical protein
VSIFDEPSRSPLSQPTFEDVKRAVVNGPVSQIPLIGGPGAELLGLLQSPLTERHDDFIRDLERRLLELEGKVRGFSFCGLEVQGDLADQVVRELLNRGLIRDTRPYVVRGRDQPRGSLIGESWHIADLGEQFLRFVRSPDENIGRESG